MSAPFILQDQIQHHDPVLMEVISVEKQEITARILKIYSQRFCGPHPYPSDLFSFTGSPGSWGNVTLQPSEKALVFVSFLPHAGRHYQHNWHGHLSVKEISGIECGIANWQLPIEHAWEPSYLRSAAFLPNPSVPWQVAMPLVLIERYINDSLALNSSKKEQNT